MFRSRFNVSRTKRPIGGGERVTRSKAERSGRSDEQVHSSQRPLIAASLRLMADHADPKASSLSESRSYAESLFVMATVP